MIDFPKIVVITPVKNEAWILERFLQVTSEFADHIIIADQNSTDGSRNICMKYAKVHLIENSNAQYNEASRQKLLIETARKLVPGPRILLALDSDELLAADAMETIEWKRMLNAKPGTILYFEKPDLLHSLHQAIRYRSSWPLGYVDDGCEHNPRIIHSVRIPQPDYAVHMDLYNIKILHYALTRPAAQASKMRFYSVLENVNHTMKFYTRRKGYGLKRDFTKEGTVEPSNPLWFEGWTKKGIDMFTISNSDYYWQDFEVLKLFKKHGYKKFWLDDIWYFDWEKFRKHAISIGEAPNYPIKNPPALLVIMLRICDNLQRLYNRFKYIK